MKSILTLLITAIITFQFTSQVDAAIIRVRTGGNNANSGLTWANAKKTVTAGLAAASSGGEVWVEKGNYAEQITLKQGVGLYGGFAGTETSRSNRNADTNITFLDGSQLRNVVTVPAQAGSTTVIDGFNIVNGKADKGAGIFCSTGASPTITGNIITGNTAVQDGAGIYCDSNASPSISNNTISNNGAVNGGGIYSYSASPQITSNTITANSASGDWSNGGGGICCSGGNPIITNNVISQNYLSAYAPTGGGVCCSDSICEIAFNIISDNTVCGEGGIGGGGIYCTGGSVVIHDNTIKGNIVDVYYEGYGGGISSGGTAIIYNNLIEQNRADGPVYRSYEHGGGISCSGSETIRNNSILGNYADCGGGIDCSNAASPTISGNIIAGNTAASGGGIYCSWSDTATPIITNNTVVGNSDTGIGCDSAAATISNNIVAFNTIGVSRSDGMVALRKNCVYGNTHGNYVNMSPGVGDISTDPKLAAGLWGNLHIQPGSPCIDTGWNSAPGVTSVDMDGQPRKQDGTGYGTLNIDIGADESDRTTWPGQTIIRVSTTGNDANNGLSWQAPKRHIQAAIDAISATGGEVWVKAGTYYERINAGMFVHIYGGFQGNETSRTNRNWTANITSIDGQRLGNVVSLGMCGLLSTIDGFTIRNGGHGVYEEYASPSIANNTITNNISGIYCSGGSPTISNNTISSNTSSGVACMSAHPLISRNLIDSNSAEQGAGIWCGWRAYPLIENNTICRNQAVESESDSSGIGGAVFCNGYSSPGISNNLIYDNSAKYGGAVYCGGYGEVIPGIFNNTIVGNTAVDGSIYSDYASPVVDNNIVAFNSAGIYGYTWSIMNNCMYGNENYNYKECDPSTNDISLDPKLQNVSLHDFHLKSDSPCINAGYNFPGYLSSQDFDGDQRVIGGAVDIGADESSSVSSALTSLSIAKSAKNNSWVRINGCIVSASFYPSGDCDYFYIEANNRANGIRVEKPGHNMSYGERADVEGVIRTNTNGERYIHPVSVTQSGTGDIYPLGMANKTIGGGPFGTQAGVLGGKGLNNIGLLVMTFGTVTYAEYNYFYINDGSNLRDGSEHVGIKVYGNVPVENGEDPVGKFVSVVGVSSCEQMGSSIVRVIRTREPADITLR